MSHFSSPRRCISAGAASVRSATQDEPNQPGSTQSVEILFDGGRSTAAGRQHERPIPEISADGWRKFSARSHASRPSGPSPTRVRDAFLATTSICVLVHRYFGRFERFRTRAVVGATPSDDGGAAMEKCGAALSRVFGAIDWSTGGRTIPDGEWRGRPGAAKRIMPPHKRQCGHRETEAILGREQEQ